MNSLAVNSGSLRILGGRNFGNFATRGPLTNSGDVSIGAGSSLTVGSRTGDFASATGMTLPNGLVLDRSFDGSGMWLTAASPLLAAAACECATAQRHNAAQARTLWDAAQSWLAASGLPTGGLARLSKIQVRVADLPSGYLGAAYGSVVVLHEMGHALGLDHGLDADGVLFELLSAGQRRRFSTEELDAILSLWHP